MLQLPAYFLPRPPAKWGADVIASFEQLFTQAVQQGHGTPLEYTLAAPKWQFLCYLCDHKRILLHGSGDADIEEFEPRKSDDVNEFGNRRAVYAASDGIWPIFFAIVDRDRYVTSLVNGCFRVIETTGKSEPLYYFSVNRDALPYRPWRNGAIYLLSKDTFELQPRQHVRGMEIEIPQWASLVAVRPLAKLVVKPEDFPFLTAIHAHDPSALRARAQADPEGFPWPDE